MSAFDDRKKPFSECIEIYLSEHTRLKGRASSKRHSSEVLTASFLSSVGHAPLSSVCGVCGCVGVCACNRSQPQPQPAIRAIQIALVVASIRIEIQSSTRRGIQLNAYRAHCSCFEPSEAQHEGWEAAQQGRGGNCWWHSIRQQ